ncbi:MAG: metallophosphoesterase [Candidatus Paceibacterota bacterium]|jgi:hypothetical protein
MTKIFDKRYIRLIVLIILLLVLGISIFISRTERVDKQTGPSFIFTSAGDYGVNSFTVKNLKNIAKEMPDLHFVLGDLSYDEVKPETEWCNMMKKYLPSVPIELLAGNHESDGQNGSIEKFISCLPNVTAGIKGEYGKEYYFDYPEEKPLIRFILISPNLHFSDGQTFVYSTGSKHMEWLKKVIDEGHQKEIPWTIVGMHKICISAGGIHGCEIGEELINYLLAHNVDLIMQGHEHSYQRTKQLVCVKLNMFDPACLGEDTSPEDYKQGNGGIITIVGTGGAPSRKIDFNDPEVPYFASLEGDIYGFLRVEVTEKSLRGMFYSLSGVKDEFKIVR